MEDFLLNIHDHFTELPQQVRLIFLCSGIFLSVSLVLFSIIIISRIVDNFNSRRTKVLEAKAIDNIISFLYDEHSWNNKRLIKLKNKYLQTQFTREVFLSCLTRFQINIVGNDAKRLKTLYKGLKLHRSSLKKLNSFFWNVKVRGIIELAEMDMKEYIPEIKAFINDKNTVLRSEAKIALIQLEAEHPFDFLNSLKKPLTDWEQLQIAHVSEQLDPSTLPDFTTWLDHKQESVIVFCLRMISLHNQLKASDQLISLLHNQDTSSRVFGAVVFALGQLDIQESTAYIKLLYPHKDVYVQQEIINTLGLFKCEEPDTILNTILDEEKQFYTQFYEDSTVFVPRAGYINRQYA